MQNFISKKFILTLLLLLVITCLKTFGVLSDLYFTISFLSIYLAYIYIQGRIDVTKFEVFKFGDFEFIDNRKNEKIGKDNER